MTLLFCGLVLDGVMKVSATTSSESSGLTPIPKPSVPEFTVEFGNYSYDVPTTYSIDPFTGENVTHQGYHVQSKNIDVKIKNQQFVPYYDAGRDWNIKFFYNIRIKGHFSEEWIELYRASDGYPIPSDSTYSIFSYVLEESGDSKLGTILIEFPDGAVVDFQVEAMIGYVHRVYNPEATHMLEMYPWVLTGEKSGWSETQTITIGENTHIGTTEIPEFPSWTILPLVLSITLFSVVVKRKLTSS